jgi:uncharacterized protein (TIGR03066 family)
MKSSIKIAQLSLVFLFSFFILSVTTPSFDEKIVGQWELVKITGKRMSKGDKGERLEFKSDGTVYALKNSGENKDEAKFIGKWEVDAETMSLIIVERNGNEEEMEILKITDKKMILSERKGKEIHLKKVG